MPLPCNIDSRGKRFRLIIGCITLAIAALVMIIAWMIGSMIAWAISIVLILSGVFTIFEARAGWCAVRAMGFKTRI